MKILDYLIMLNNLQTYYSKFNVNMIKNNSLIAIIKLYY